MNAEKQRAVINVQQSLQVVSKLRQTRMSS